VIVAVASRKASPGVSTLTALLAAFWNEPGVVRLIVEADVSGGTMAARWHDAHGLSWDPGLLALSASRGTVDAAAISRVTQELAPAIRIAAAPPSPAQIGPALTTLGERGAAALAESGTVRSFVDCGRLTATCPAIHLARRAALTLLVCRPTLEEIHTLLPGVSELREAGCRLGLVCIGDGPYHPTEIAAEAQLPLLGSLPRDDRGAAHFASSGLPAGRGFAKSVLARSMPELTSIVQARCAVEGDAERNRQAEVDDLLPREALTKVAQGQLRD
jgi:hypothetical protein